MPRTFNYNEAEAIITRHGGTFEGVINWNWAHFPTDAQGEACFKELCDTFPDMDHRGYSKAQPDADNTNLHLGGFRYR